MYCDIKISDQIYPILDEPEGKYVQADNAVVREGIMDDNSLIFLGIGRWPCESTRKRGPTPRR